MADIYRDDVGITEVIKLYGSTESADCHIDWLTKLSVGTEVFIAMGIEYNGQNVGFDYVNPDNLYEDFWEFAPNLCTTIILNSDAKNVYGWITPSIIEYPTEAFLLGLENCDFSLEELNMYRCTDIDFVLYPNPAKDGMIEIKNSYISTAIQSIRIINLAGKIVYFEEFNKDPFQKASIKFANSGFYIMEIHCNENIEYRKFLVE